jgi:hypothetical protein
MSSTLTKRHQRSQATPDSSLYDSQLLYNYPSSSKAASPPLSYTPLSHPSSCVSRERPVQDPYRTIADDARRLRRVRQQQQARQHYARRSLDYGATTPTIDSDEDDLSEDDDDFDEGYPATVSMRRLGSNGSGRQHRSRTLSGGSATSSIAFAAPPSPRVSGSPSINPTPLPMWPTTSSSSKYAIPSYSPPDPSSPFTQSHLFFEDENESDDDSARDRRASTTKTGASTRRAVIRLPNFAGRRESESKRRPSLEIAPTDSVMSSEPASVQSVISLPDTVDT